MPQRVPRVGQPVGLASAEPTTQGPSLRGLIGALALMELLLLALIVVAPRGGMTQTVSPLARAWPWILAPARLLFPNTPLHVGARYEHGYPPWPGYIFTGLLVAAAVVGGVAALASLRTQGSRGHHLALALGGAAALGAALILLPSLPSDDIFSYITYGRLTVIHHTNPLVAVPGSYPQDPFLPLVYWRSVRSVYGPVWLLVSGGLTVLAEALGGALATYVLLFKLLGLACHLANIVLIWAILSRIAPGRRLFGALLYGWNPLCLLEFCASAHNDALMLTFLLVGVLCLVRYWEGLALVAFGLAIATKYVPLVLLPLYLAAVVRQDLESQVRADRGVVAWVRLRWPARPLPVALASVGWRLALVLAVVVITALPYWAGPGTLKAILYSPPAERLDNSWLEAVGQPLIALARVGGLRPSISQNVVEAVLKVSSVLAFGLLWLRGFRRARGLDGTLEAWAWALYWYVVVASGWFWSWYVTWPVAVVALLPWTEISTSTVLLAGGALILYAFRPLRGVLGIYDYRSLFIFGPAVGYLAWRAWQRRRKLASGSANRLPWPLGGGAVPSPSPLTAKGAAPGG